MVVHNEMTLLDLRDTLRAITKEHRKCLDAAAPEDRAILDELYPSNRTSVLMYVDIRTLLGKGKTIDEIKVVVPPTRN